MNGNNKKKRCLKTGDFLSSDTFVWEQYSRKLQKIQGFFFVQFLISEQREKEVSHDQRQKKQSDSDTEEHGADKPQGIVSFDETVFRLIRLV